MNDLERLEKIINKYSKKVDKVATDEDFEKVYTEHLKQKYKFDGVESFYFYNNRERQKDERQ